MGLFDFFRKNTNGTNTRSDMETSFNRGDYQRCISIANNILADDSMNNDALYFKASALYSSGMNFFKQGNVQSAKDNIMSSKDTYTKLLGKWPDQPQALLYRGMACMNLVTLTINLNPSKTIDLVKSILENLDMAIRDFTHLINFDINNRYGLNTDAKAYLEQAKKTKDLFSGDNS